MKIIVCEDERAEQDLIQRYMGKVLESLGIQYHLRFVDSGEALIREYRSGGRYDLVLLDIYMEGKNGIDAGNEIRQMDESVPIAFLTNSMDYAVQAFQMDALHYLVKPVTEDKIHDLLIRLLKRVNKPITYFEISNSKINRRFPMNQIVRVVSSDKGIEVHMKNKEDSEWLPVLFRQAEEQLIGKENFLHLSRGCIGNMDYIAALDYDVCRFSDGAEVNISRRERGEVRRQYSDYLFRKLDEEKEGVIGKGMDL